MLTVQPRHELDAARERAELSQVELWLRYFALGGMAPALEVEAIVSGALVPSTADHDRLALALNERFSETGSASSVPYTRDVTG